MGKFYSFVFVLVVFLFIGDAQFSLCSNSSYHGCNDKEIQTLLKFKQSLKDPMGKLSSWEGGTDCCKWKGIGCNTSTGHVVKLDLQRIVNEEFDTLDISQMNSSLLELKHLSYLDLSGNSFGESNSIPEFFGEMEGLRYLNLSRTDPRFGFIIPPQLGNLTNLQVLDLTYMSAYGPIMEDLQWISRLSSLKHLDLSGMDLYGARNLWQVLNMLPSLSVLGLSSCGLNDTHLLSPTHLNSTLVSSIQEVYLSRNKFKGPFPYLLRNMTSLRVLDLSDDEMFSPNLNFINSSIPQWLGNLKNLVHLDLSVNNFNRVEGGLSTILWNLCYLKSLYLYKNKFQEDSLETNKNSSKRCIGYDLEVLNVANSGWKGSLPDWLGHQFNKLNELDLSSNSLHGPIPTSIGKLHALEKLDLSNNLQLNGDIPATLGNLSALTELHLSNNQLNGIIPTTIGNLLALQELDLSHNQLNGVIPDSIGQLSELKNMDLSSNFLEGEISEIHFSNLSKLNEYRISSNHYLSIKMKAGWVPPFQLKYMEMESCKIGTPFPQWLETQKELIKLVLSNASISGPLPKWFHGSNLVSLDLSRNQITGPIPEDIGDAFPTLAGVQLAHNLINGTIPSSFCQMESLWNLDLSNNMLSGDIPNCWTGKGDQGLTILKLSSNKLTGVIPSSLGNLSWLAWLHLNNNSLKGELPVSLTKTRMIIMNLGENGFSGNIPTWIGTDMKWLQILRLRQNMFDGYIPPQLCQLDYLQILDLAGNNLTGTIPRCLGNLTGMILKPSKDRYDDETFPSAIHDLWEEQNVEVVLKATNREYRKILQLVVNMDLSDNKLVGIIPEELTNLFELLGLNLSHNHLMGNIPKNIGKLMSLESLDLSKNQLSGNIPTSMSDIPSLSYLNLSHNSFSGKIPTGNQLQTLVDPSIYVGNPELCGAPLLKRCPGDEPAQVPIPTSDEENDEEDNKSDKVWFYIAITLGYATGLWAVIGTLVFKRNWRYAYFRFADETKVWIYMTIAVIVVRLKKKIMGRNHSVE